MNQKTDYENLHNEDHVNDEINFLIFINFLLRNKILIGAFSLFSFILFTLYSFTKKRSGRVIFKLF